jgi:hypothetical protein
MANSQTYYESVKNQQHVFLYSVAGRSSSTALQRIINSSNKVWLWGEPHGIIDDAISQINNMKKLRDTDFVKASLIHMYNSYDTNKHIYFYPNAIGNIDTTIDLINSSISNILKPWAIRLKRFGFKDIGVKEIQTLEHLKEIFPKSFFIFCFRNPLEQWCSVSKLQHFWSYAKDLQAFLDEYSRISTIYMEFAKKNDVELFIENADLKNYAKIKKIIHRINIPKIDKTLINLTVSSMVNRHNLAEREKKVILSSKAYNNYLKMKDLSDLFYSNH